MSIDESVSYGLIQNQPENKNTLQNTRFRMLIRRLPNTTYFLQSANLPGLDISAVRQHTVFNTVFRPGGEVSHNPVTVNFIVDEDISNWKEIRNWILECSNYKDFTEYRPPAEHFSDEITLTILTNTHNITHKAVFSNAFPIALSDLNFTTIASGDEILTASMQFKFTSYDINVE
jgi:hypothetical protein